MQGGGRLLLLLRCLIQISKNGKESFASSLAVGSCTRRALYVLFLLDLQTLVRINQL